MTLRSAVTLRDGASVQCLDGAVARTRGDLALDPVAKPVHLGPLVINLGFLQVDLVVSECDEVTM